MTTNKLKIEDFTTGDKVKLLLSLNSYGNPLLEKGSTGYVHSTYDSVDKVSVNLGDDTFRLVHIRFLEIVEKKPDGLCYVYPPGKLVKETEVDEFIREQHEEWRQAIRKWNDR